MSKYKVISFDVEGTLVPGEYSHKIWHEDIPALYARARKLDPVQAKVLVEKEYDAVGSEQKEWYDIAYWFERFGLGDFQYIFEQYRNRMLCYPEAPAVLETVRKQHTVIASSATTRQFLPYLLNGIEPYFTRIFSSTSDYHRPKDAVFYRTICREIGVNPEQVLHIGDSWEFDIISAREIGIDACYLDRKNPGADHAIASLTEIIEILKKD